MRKIAEIPSLLDRLDGLYFKFASEAERKRREEARIAGAPPRDTRREIVNALEHAYGPILMTAGFFAFFAGTDAAQEVILGFVTALNDGLLSTSQGVPLAQSIASKLISLFLLAAVQIFCFSLAYNALRITGELSLVATRVLAVIPGLAIILTALAFWRAMQSPEWPGWTMYSIAAAAFLAAMMIGHAIYVALPIWRQQERTRNGGPVVDLTQRVFVWIALILLVACAAIGLVRPIYAVAAGPIGVAAGFAIFGAALLSLLTVLSTLMPGRFPLIVLVGLLGIAVSSQTAAIIIAVIAAIVFFINFDRKHPVATVSFGVIFGLCVVYAWGFSKVEECITLAGCNLVEGVGEAGARAPELTEAVAAFEADLPPGTPLRIVAAQGGGLFAAHHTATYLAARADTDPDFARSIFAVSGVSGGSVGAGIYWAVRKSGLCPAAPTDCNLTAVRKIVERDYLSPALAGLLFRDNLDNVLPVSALATGAGFGPIDRGNLLESSLTRAVRQWRRSQGTATPGRLLEIPIAGSYDFAAGAPMLFMNGTRVDNGERYVLSPIRSLKPVDDGLELFITDPNDPRYYMRYKLASGHGLSVVNAMVISARFPVVTPPARIVQKTHRANAPTDTLQLVDGGYYDNSGIETALDLVVALREAGVTRFIEIVQLKVDEVPDGGATIADPTQPAMKGTLGAPLSGFFGAWRARIGLSERRFSDTMKQKLRGANVFLCPVTLKADGFNFTLSWYLARGSFESIVGQVKKQSNDALKGQRFCTLASALH